MLEDRAGKDVQFLANNLNKFLDAARKRPEIAGLSTTFLPSVPQKFVDVDREKVLKQGVPLNDVYRTIQAFMGGYVRQLLQPVRPAVASAMSRPKATYRAKLDNVGQFYVRNNKGEMVPLSALTNVRSRVSGRNSPCATTCTARRRLSAALRRATARTRR